MIEEERKEDIMALRKANTLIKEKDEIIEKNNKTIENMLKLVENSTDNGIKKEICELLGKD